ncbi:MULTISPECIES: hypothetical protein [Bacillaceae]|uniref:Uncharacterized protein n=1 Tax=Evansella alkalicola TaxID=745819 RepID=A0ABS6JTD7_9BACI|nr:MULTISPECIES: hypothetical protein [Bacillaceae]MBU9721819.1 hypothetical protein [Bacillus alkalicola]
MFTAISVFGYLALIAVLLNFSMYFLFLWIKKSRNKVRRKQLASIARKWMKTHRPVALIATLLIFNHGLSVLIYSKGFSTSIPFITGAVTGVVFLILLVTGIFRNQKATGKRRRSHLLMAFIFIIILSLHIITTF